MWTVQFRFQRITADSSGPFLTRPCDAVDHPGLRIISTNYVILRIRDDYGPIAVEAEVFRPIERSRDRGPAVSIQAGAARTRHRLDQTARCHVTQRVTPAFQDVEAIPDLEVRSLLVV